MLLYLQVHADLHVAPPGNSQVFGSVGFCSFVLQNPLLNFPVKVPNGVPVFLMDADCAVLAPEVVPEKRPSKMGLCDWPTSTPGLECSVGKCCYFVACAAFLGLNVIKVLLSQYLRGPNACLTWPSW